MPRWHRVSRCMRDLFACECRIRNDQAMRKRETTSNKRRRKKIVELKTSNRKATTKLVRRTTSHLVIKNARSFALVVGGIDLEIGEERACFLLQKPQHPDRHAPDFELGALAAAQLEHRAPRARVPRDDDLHLGRVR